MPVKNPRRLPKKFSRRVSKDTKRYVARRMKKQKKHSRERWRRLWRRVQVLYTTWREQAIKIAAAVTILLGLAVFLFLVFSPAITVREIQVTRESPRLDIEEVQQALAPMFNKHLFFLSQFEVANLLRENIHDIASVSMDKIYPSTLHVSIALDPLTARLRIIDPEVDVYSYVHSGATLDFLTDDGLYVVTLAAQDTEVLPEIYVVDWGVRPLPGAPLINPLFIERMSAAEITLLRQFGQEVTRRIVYVRAQEFHLQIGGISLWFDLKSPLEEQLQRYQTFLQEQSLDDVQEYIDLRVQGRVIYK